MFSESHFGEELGYCLMDDNECPFQRGGLNAKTEDFKEVCTAGAKMIPK